MHVLEVQLGIHHDVESQCAVYRVLLVIHDDVACQNVRRRARRNM
jgi:hypothetical protein